MSVLIKKSFYNIRYLPVLVLTEIKYQGSIAEESSAQKLHQGARKNVLNIIFS